LTFRDIIPDLLHACLRIHGRLFTWLLKEITEEKVQVHWPYDYEDIGLTKSDILGILNVILEKPTFMASRSSRHRLGMEVLFTSLKDMKMVKFFAGYLI